MKKRFALIAAAVLLLGGCSSYDTSSAGSSAVKDTSSKSSRKKQYDSSVTFQAEDADKLEICMAIAAERLKAEYPGMEPEISYPVHDTAVMEFDRPGGWDDQSLEKACKTCNVTIRKGTDYNIDEAGNCFPQGEVILTNTHISSANVTYPYADSAADPEYVVQLNFNEAGKAIFAEVTAELQGTSEPLSIWVDSTLISAPTVTSAITDGQAIISGDFTYDSAAELAGELSSTAMPCELSIIEYNIGTGDEDNEKSNDDLLRGRR